MRRRAAAGVCLIVCLACCGCAKKAVAALPPGVKIVRPVGVPSSVAAFSGEWRGRWDTGKDAILAVERVGPKNADVVYAWAKGSQRGSWKATGSFEGAELSVVSAESNIPFVFHVSSDGTLAGHWEGFGTATSAVFKRLGGAT